MKTSDTVLHNESNNSVESGSLRNVRAKCKIEEETAKLLRFRRVPKCPKVRDVWIEVKSNARTKQFRMMFYVENSPK